MSPGLSGSSISIVQWAALRNDWAPDYYKKHDLPSYSAFPLAKYDFLELTHPHAQITGFDVKPTDCASPPPLANANWKLNASWAELSGEGNRHCKTELSPRQKALWEMSGAHLSRKWMNNIVSGRSAPTVRADGSCGRSSRTVWTDGPR